jgi:hypothetical protein
MSLGPGSGGGKAFGIGGSANVLGLVPRFGNDGLGRVRSLLLEWRAIDLGQLQGSQSAQFLDL